MRLLLGDVFHSRRLPHTLHLKRGRPALRGAMVAAQRRAQRGGGGERGGGVLVGAREVRLHRGGRLARSVCILLLHPQWPLVMSYG